MTISIRKKIPTELEQKYSEIRKQSDGNKRNPNWVKNVAAEPASNLPIDRVTLSSGSSDSAALPKLIRSQSVSLIEKKALQGQFSIHA